MASDGDFCQKAVIWCKKLGNDGIVASEKIVKTLDLQGVVRCRTVFVMSRSQVRVPSQAPGTFGILPDVLFLSYICDLSVSGSGTAYHRGVKMLYAFS